MARKARKRRRHGSRGRSKGLGGRILLIAGLVLALLYFAFTKVLFDPFEGDQPAYQLLVPRDVDLFVRREALASDVVDDEGLPVPRIYERLRNTAKWREFQEGTYFTQLTWPDELERLVDEVQPQLRELPLDPVADVLGQEVVLIGRDLQGSGQWALMARLSARAKLAVEIFGFDATLESAVPGATRELLRDGEHAEVSYFRVSLPGPGGLALPGVAGAADGEVYFYARETDLLVVSDDESLIRDVLRFVKGASDSERSVGLSRTYDGHLPRTSADPSAGFSAEFAVAAGTLLKSWGLTPDTTSRSEDALANILLGLIDTELLEDVVGRLDLGQGSVSLRMHGEIDFGRASTDQGGLLGQRDFIVRDRLGETLGLMPTDLSALVTMNVALGRFLTTVSSGFSPDVLRLVNSTLRDVASLTAGRQVDTVPEMIAELSRALGDEITIAMRPLDHEIPEGSQPLPATVLLLPIDDLETWLAVEDSFLRAHALFGVSNDGGMLKLDEGVGERRWLSFVNQPFEEIAYIVLDGEMLALSTDNDLLREVVQIYTGARMSLAGQEKVANLLDAFDQGGLQAPRGNAAAWVSADSLQVVLEPYAAYAADLATIIDFGVERQSERRKIIQRAYPQFKGADSLPPDVEDAVNEELDRILDEMEATRRRETIPALAQKWAQEWAWLPLLEQGVLGLRLGDRSMNFELHLETMGAR
jgi:hypothetical protein